MSISEKPAVVPKECSHLNMGGRIRIREENLREGSDRWLEKFKGNNVRKGGGKRKFQEGSRGKWYR